MIWLDCMQWSLHLSNGKIKIQLIIYLPSVFLIWESNGFKLIINLIPNDAQILRYPQNLSRISWGMFRARLVHVFKNWKLLFENFCGNTCGWKSVLKYVKCCLKTENCCLKTLTKHPLRHVQQYNNKVLIPNFLIFIYLIIFFWDWLCIATTVTTKFLFFCVRRLSTARELGFAVNILYGF